MLNFRPFERTAAENDQIYSIVHWYPDLSCQVEPLVLKELCVVAQLEVWKEANITCTSSSNTYRVITADVKYIVGQYIKLLVFPPINSSISLCLRVTYREAR